MRPLGRLLGLIGPHKWWIALAVLLSFGTVGAGVGLMAMSAYLISKAALVTGMVDLALAITGVRFFAISRAALRYTERLVSHTVTFRILTRLRVWFYAGIEPLAPARLGGHRSGDLQARIVDDIETLENFYARVIVPPVVAVLVTVLAGVILGSFDWTLAAALVVFLALTGVALPLFMRRLSRGASASSAGLRGALLAATADDLQGLPELLAYGAAERARERVAAVTAELERERARLAGLRGLSHALAALFTGLAALTVLLLAISLVTGGQIAGVYLALLPLTAIAAFEAVQPLAMAYEHLAQSRAAAERLFDLIDAAPPISEPDNPAPPPLTHGLSIRDLTFAYEPDGPAVLAGLDVTIPPGGRLALVGPSGAGKTTLVNLLLRFWEYDCGSIRLGDVELRSLAAEEARRLIGVVSQQTYLFNTTIRDNLLLARAGAPEDALWAAAEAAQLGDFLRGLPHGLDTRVGENGLQLSGGERQRLAIARALLKDAPVLILDEATANLDPVTEAAVWTALDRLMAGRTVLVITHQAAGLRHVDAVQAVARLS
jgi:thiol reductant ABC exporter CydC subunit